ncbi:hypothetical protein BMF94_7057 [Rhodotorula taiwanensis]|uniref:FAD-binding FR-type domain-containing protein n=1 Tax=Rhodotorula taiwanensis TaxID=741276 RepID=A0A2S5AZI7_9BASI|nr:hypothetical protein BMF94_7057 [Rhodotorula taiwanensis]
MVNLASLRPTSRFWRSSSSVNGDSGSAASARMSSLAGQPGQVEMKSRSSGLQPVSGLDALSVVPLTPPPAFNASFARAQSARLAGRSPLGLLSAPKTLNESEQDRLQGLMRADTLRARPRGKNGEVTDRDGETLWLRFKVWLGHDGKVPLLASIWILIQIAVFAIGIFKYDFSPQYESARSTFGPTFVIARSAALVLHVDIAFILLPICRNFVTLMRNSVLRNCLPFDEATEFHKFAAWSSIFFTAVHTIAHIVNSYLLGHAMSRTTVGTLGHGLLCNLTTGPFLTGWLMIAILALMAFFAAEKRRRAHFERFQYSHLLFLPFFGLWQLHGMFCMIRPNTAPFCSWKQVGVFWFYWALGGCLYFVERMLREIRSRHRTYISKVVHHPNQVVEVQIKKERMRRARAGQYIMINCPAVSYWQWHPFTLTSAPEEDPCVHIRIVGDWTREFAAALGCETGRNELYSKDLGGEDPQSPLSRILPRVMIDGPFGTASEDVFDYEVAVLVGGGIGVTPFASILKHIWYRSRAAGAEPLKLRKVYFFWVSREPASFEWFQSLLEAIEAQDADNLIEIYSYMTGHLGAGEIGNIFTNDVGTDRDAITGLRAPTHYGRPDWDRIFASIAAEHVATSVGVFCCGPAALSSTLHKMSLKHTSGQRGAARFVYHKERF